MSEEELNQMSNNELIGIIKAQRFEINRKYHEIVASRIKDREKQILRQLTYEEQEEIYNKTAKELG